MTLKEAIEIYENAAVGQLIPQEVTDKILEAARDMLALGEDYRRFILLRDALDAHKSDNLIIEEFRISYMVVQARLLRLNTRF